MEQLVERIRNLLERGKTREAGNLATQLIRLHADNPQAWRERALVRRAQRRYAGAMADIQKAIALNDFWSLNYRFTKGLISFKMAKYRTAIDEFTQTIALGKFLGVESFQVEAHFFRAECYMRMKKFAKAQADCKNVPDDFRTWTDKLRTKEDLLSECSLRSRRIRGK